MYVYLYSQSTQTFHISLLLFCEDGKTRVASLGPGCQAFLQGGRVVAVHEDGVGEGTQAELHVAVRCRHALLVFWVPGLRPVAVQCDAHLT